jgi:hypothetical protein
MFGLFKKKSEKEKLQEQYEKLMKEAHSLSTSNRKLSDDKIYEAEEVMKQLERMVYKNRYLPVVHDFTRFDTQRP